MKIRIKCIIALAACMPMLAACSDENMLISDEQEKTEQEDPAAPSEEENGENNDPVSNPVTVSFTPSQNEINRSVNDLAFYLLDKSCEINGEATNTAISPVSIALCLGMLANSSDDYTAASVAEALGYSDLGDFNEVCRQLIKFLPCQEHGAQLSLANSVWYDHSLTVPDSYSQFMTDLFASQIFPEDFSSKSTVDLVNKWCSDNTNGMIDKIISEINAAQKVMFLNALYFAGAWRTPFDKSLTHSSLFTTPAGSVSVDMMQKDFRTIYHYNDTYESAAINFKGQATELVLYLPREGVSVKQLIESVKSGSHSSKDAIVHLGLPKFDISCTLDMSEILPEMGINLMSVIPSPMGQNIEFSFKFIHKAAAKFDEDGATVAAVSYAGGEAADLPVEPDEITLTLDRPFIYTIRNTKTGSYIMAGYVARP